MATILIEESKFGVLTEAQQLGVAQIVLKRPLKPEDQVIYVAELSAAPDTAPRALTEWEVLVRDARRPKIKVTPDTPA